MSIDKQTILGIEFTRDVKYSWNSKIWRDPTRLISISYKPMYVGHDHPWFADGMSHRTREDAVRSSIKALHREYVKSKDFIEKIELAKLDFLQLLS